MLEIIRKSRTLSKSIVDSALNLYRLFDIAAIKSEFSGAIRLVDFIVRLDKLLEFN